VNAPPLCTRCGLADATCDLVLTPAFAQVLGRAKARLIHEALCDRCWDDLFGTIPSVEQYVIRRALIGEQDMDVARAMVERVEWGEGSGGVW
jgi:hypothetical protein